MNREKNIFVALPGVLILTFIICQGAQGESLNTTTRHITPVAARSEGIMLWCNAATNQKIYTTKRLAPKGYAPCGQLSRVAYCDPLGDKYYGPKDTAPHGYLECALGPRISNKDGGLTRKALFESGTEENIRDPGARRKDFNQAKTIDNLLSDSNPASQSLARTLSPLVKNNNSAEKEDLDFLRATLTDLLSKQMKHTTRKNKSELAGRNSQSNQISKTNLPQDAEKLINALPNDGQKGMIEQIFMGYLGYLGQLDALAAEIP